MLISVRSTIQSYETRQLHFYQISTGKGDPPIKFFLIQKSPRKLVLVSNPDIMGEEISSRKNIFYLFTQNLQIQ
jgi:hypothetical protein